MLRREWDESTDMQRRRADGHLARTGHRLIGYFESENGKVWRMIRTCCDTDEIDTDQVGEHDES